MRPAERSCKDWEGILIKFNAVEWSADGQYLASASADKTIGIWHAASGKHLQTLKGHTSQVWSVTWSQDAQHLILSSPRTEPFAYGTQLVEKYCKC